MIKKSVWLCALLALAACSDDDGPDADNGGDTPPGGDASGGNDSEEGKSLRIVSYNVGLYRGYVEYAERRTAPVLEAITALEDADVLCLQELWEDEDIAAFRSTLEATYPHIILRRTMLDEESTDAQPLSDAGAPDAGEEMAQGCTAEEARPLADCAGPACETAGDLATCVLGMCGTEFSSLSPSCSTCAVQNLGLGDVAAILDACVTGTAPGYTNDGHNGLMLLSKKPIEGDDFVQFNSFLTRRAALYGEVDGLPITCTHLTANVQTQYDGEFGSYSEENAMQVDELIAYIDGKASSRPAVIAGDFNNGPALEGITGAVPENYQRFVDAGYGSANAASQSPACSLCTDNTLTPGIPNLLIDHVVVRGALTSDPAQLFNQTVTLPAQGDEPEVTTSLSDHYGIAATVRWNQ